MFELSRGPVILPPGASDREAQGAASPPPGSLSGRSLGAGGGGNGAVNLDKTG